MKELISLFLGQAGLRQSQAVWQLLCSEHNVSADAVASTLDCSSDAASSVFSISKKDETQPLALLIDTDPIIVDEIRTGRYRSLVRDDLVVTANEDTASLFSRGFFRDGRRLLPQVSTALHRVLEACDSPRGMVSWHALGGGTGSGLHALLIEELIEPMTSAKRMLCAEVATFPTTGELAKKTSNPVIVEPYNSVLSKHWTMDSTNISFLVDNEALFQLLKSHVDIKKPSFSSVNKVVAHIFSGITAPFRFGSHSIQELSQNLIPYPRIHYPVTNLASLTTSSRPAYAENSASSLTISGLLRPGCETITTHELSPISQPLMSCCLIYRGLASSSPNFKSDHQAIHHLLHTARHQKYISNSPVFPLRFVDWCPTGLKTIFCNTRLSPDTRDSDVSISDANLTVLLNTPAIANNFLLNLRHYKLMLSKCAFVHWFIGEGLEKEEFIDASENISCLVFDYQFAVDDKTPFPSSQKTKCPDLSSPLTSKKQHNVSHSASPNHLESSINEADKENVFSLNEIYYKSLINASVSTTKWLPETQDLLTDEFDLDDSALYQSSSLSKFADLSTDEQMSHYKSKLLLIDNNNNCQLDSFHCDSMLAAEPRLLSKPPLPKRCKSIVVGDSSSSIVAV